MYDTIFIRQSIRKFDFASVSQETFQSIVDFADHVKPLISDIQAKIFVLSANDIKSSALTVKAPYYAVVCSGKQNGYLENAGYMAEQMCLYLHKENFGACYSGTAKVKSSVFLPYPPVVIIAFGSGRSCIDRGGESYFKRKPIEEIYTGTRFEKIIRAARIAPSAFNNQPWYFSERGNTVDVFRLKNKWFNEILLGSRTRVDIGIAISHICIAAQELGYTSSTIVLGNKRIINNKIHNATVTFLKI